MSTISIGGRMIGPDCPVFVIAEAGVNHNGELDLALALVDAAADARADAVKFQTFSAESVAGAAAPKAPYQLETTDPSQSQREMLAALELSEDAHRAIMGRCAERGIVFLSSVFDEPSVDLLARLGVPGIKIGSGEITNWPLLRHTASAGLPMIVSTGMSTLEEVRGAVSTISSAGNPPIALLHCLSSYPAPADEANLNAIATLREAFARPIGYSDHTVGFETSLAAVALGACILEKHLTLDRDLPGPDHRASLEPSEFAEYVSATRVVEACLGDGVKRAAPSELPNREVARRGLVAARNLVAGHVLMPADIGRLRPAVGLPPSEQETIIGRRLLRDLPAGEPLTRDAVEGAS